VKLKGPTLKMNLRASCCALLLAVLALPAAAADRVLRVCAEPDNLPLSHRDGSGLENRVARLLADELGARLETHWIPLQGRIVSATLGARACDVLLGVPEGFPRTATTRPYYRSSFVWVQRSGEPPLSFDDPRLSAMRMGVPRIRHDIAATPPAFALQELGHGQRLVGFPLEDGQLPQRLVSAVAERELDAAVLWGPQAGWLVQRHGGTLQQTPVTPHATFTQLPMQVSMALAVRPADRDLLAELDQALVRRQPQIGELLREFNVPLSDGGPSQR
jgi:mxaJ protein